MYLYHFAARAPGREGGQEMEWIGQLAQSVVMFAQTVRVTDILDVALVAYLVYRLMLLVSRTSTANVAKAIVILVVALWVSGLLRLYVVNFILGRALELGFLALVVIFQPELRKLLEQLGSNRLTTFFTKEESVSELERAITQTVAAYTAFSKDRVGALMVFERKNLLDEIVNTGTPLDCAVDAMLLKNLFWDKAPLHDGAVIVRTGRVVGAGCMLPLTESTSLSRDLGMRHRAGVGASERTDAVVAIVSEETGSISVAIGGMLRQHLAPDSLEKLLRSELMSAEEEKKEERSPILNGLLKFLKGGAKNGEK